MANRKRNIQIKFYVTEDEKRLIDEKMSQLPTRRYGAYLRKMAIDGYIIYTDTADIKAFTKELSAIGRNINPDCQADQRRRSCVSGRHGRDTGKAGRDMAVTKTHPIKSTLKAAIDYICNPEKTDGKLLVSSYGCAAETADIEFAWTRRHAIDKGTNLGRHLIQAFQPGEVTPEQAHEIGMKLAKEILGGKYEFVLTTHIDKDHVHNHLIFNAVSFADHKHYHSNKRSYHYIRRTSDRLCKEHGLSVIIPGQDKGKSYIEHQATQNGTSYKAKLKAAIDRLLPACSDLEELLRRLQREGYEIKRGKYISAKAPDQERFTRLKPWVWTTPKKPLPTGSPEAPRPSRQPKQQNGKISLLIDIQNNIKAQQSAGFTHWAKLNNLKQAAKTMNFLTEHGISSYGELESKLTAVSARRDTAHAEIKRIETRSAELALVMKHAGTYRQLKPLYERYRKSNDKEKFLRGHESEIILFEATARELKRLGTVPLPTTESMKTELANLNAEKERLLAEYKAARTEAQEYETVKQNVDALLTVPKEQEQQRRHELE